MEANFIYGRIRKNYAQPGGFYYEEFDVFVPKQNHKSWKLNYTTYQWEAPVARPDEVEGYRWVWSEINKEWIQVQISNV